MTSTTTTPPDGGQTAPFDPVLSFLAGCHARLDGLSSVPAWSMSVEDQASALVSLRRLSSRLDELTLRVLASADNNDVGSEKAASSTAAWLAHETQTPIKQARAEVRLARSLDRDFEATRCAMAAGAVDVPQAQVIVRTISELPEEIGPEERRRGELHLIELAREHDAKTLQLLGRHLVEVIAPDEADRILGEKLAAEEEAARRRTSLVMTDNGDGTVSIRARIPVLHGGILRKGLEAIVSPQRIGVERRHDAEGNRIPVPEMLGQGFCELLERYPADRLPEAGGVNATIRVTMTIEQLRDALGPVTLDTGGEISAGEARRLACEARIIPIVLGGDSQPLDVGRARRFHTAAQREAISFRDQGCAVEGCDRPGRAVHHLDWWERDGGGTSVEDGASVCTWHHSRIHDPAYSTTRLPNHKIVLRRRQ